MSIRNPDSWAELLLDLGKRNRLINFKESGSVEILLPGVASVLERVENGGELSVYDPKLSESTEGLTDTPSAELEAHDPKRAKYYSEHARRIKKNNQILLYSRTGAPLRVLNEIRKKANTVIEETGVNVAYMTFGFLHWREKEEKEQGQSYAAPILMIPIRIEHASAVSPYSICFEEDAPLVNPTFAFKLAAEHSVELPEYTHEGFEAYFTKIDALARALGWSVSRECRIGLFSFQKINMYRDLTDHREEVLAHPQVRRLLGLPREETADASDTASSCRPIDLCNVVDADSSQLEAVRMAKEGQSFVLQGPPGSGKSQTITNIIAQLLHDGKRVLFVSEKLAALNVVYEKLKQAGLEEFCLELHSHKSNKKQVIEKLCRTLRTEKSRVVPRAESELAEWLRTDRQLESYTEELHRERPCIQKSLYGLLEDYAACRNAPDCEVEIPSIGEKNQAVLADAEKLLEQYEGFVRDLGEDWRRNAWYGYTGTDASHRTEVRLRQDLQALSDALISLSALSRPLSGDEPTPYATLSEARDYQALCHLIADTELVTPLLFEKSVLCCVMETLLELRRLAESIGTLREGLLAQHREEILSVEGAVAYRKLLEKQDSMLPRLFSKQYRALLRTLKACRTDGKKPTYEEALSVVELLEAYQDKRKEFTAREETVRTLLGADYVGLESDWERLLSELGRLSGLVERLPDTVSLSEMTAERFAACKQDFTAAAESLDAVLSPAEDALVRLSEVFDREVLDLSNAPVTEVLASCKACLDGFALFGTWCQFNLLRESLTGAQLMPFVWDTLERGISASQLGALYRKAFYRQWIEEILSQSPVLTAFTRIAHDQAVDIFASKDTDRFAINRARIRETLSARRPSTELLAPDSTVSLLLREGEKKRRQKSIRTLLAEAGELIGLLTPCFLMSPLSVSTFLGSGSPHFDTVIFDEASQIFPQDALGAIYRADQLIVVGDSRQMPPSDFFTATLEQNAEREGEEASDYESILDLCVATLPQIALKWHYRSRFESLIAFSNRAFYHGELVTFPAAKRAGEGLGVEHHLVDGTFEHGKRINLREAEYAVELIYRHIAEYPERSLGVVAFSVAQQELIDSLLMKRRRADPSAEDFFSADRPEPFFIKNLETVQGDERDTVIFSVAYGRDEKGKLLQNFGPLNRMGGERRLNVAVTRAKYHVQVISSIRAADIEAPADYMNGVRALKEYLDYAEQQSANAPERSDRDILGEEDGYALERSICAFLEENGYTSERCVGSSEYPVDIAVTDPETGDYLLAIECDGVNYYRFGNTRDRNRLRPEVLGRMGWHHYRIWSVDWYRNTAMEGERLLAALACILAGEDISDGTDGSEVPADPCENSENRENHNNYENSENRENRDNCENRENRETAVPQSYEQTQYDEPFAFPTYREADMPLLRHRYGRDLCRIIPLMLETEAPLCEEWMLLRLSPLFGSDRVTREVIEAYKVFLASSEARQVIRKNGFLYLNGQQALTFRVPRRMPREIVYIAPEELAVGMLEILRRNLSVERHALYLMLAKLLGFRRVSKPAAERMDAALELLADRTERNGETVKLKV